MKLRNKKTGEIVERDEFILIKHIDGDGSWQDGSYHSIAELNEEWEDYVPKEPLIKDEKIRKAVRAWAEANDIKQVKYLYDGNILWFGDNEIDFKYLEPLALELNEYYTIEELCGSEK